MMDRYRHGTGNKTLYSGALIDADGKPTLVGEVLDGKLVTKDPVRLLLPVYVPTALLAFGQGLMVPILPLYAADFGGSYSLAGIVVAAAWIGTMIADVPVGMLLGRLGYRRAMIIGAALFSIATIALGLANFAPELIIYRLIAGVGTAFWGLSRHAYIAGSIDPSIRGRAIATFGGINRIGWFIGPVAGGFIARFFGMPTALIAAGLLAAMALVIAILFVRDPEGSKKMGHTGRHFEFGVLREVVSYNRRDIIAAGTAQIFGQMIRAGRQIAIPLYAAYAIGLDEGQVGLVVGLASAVDMLLFIPAGMIMDRFGRKAAAVPSFTIMALGMALIPLTNSFATLLAAAMVVGFGNGIGSGTMMTLGADLAPPGRTGEFLGVWRLIGDSGQAIAPLVIGTVADIIGLTLTAGAVAGLGIISAGTMGMFVRETRWMKHGQERGSPKPQPAEND